MSRASEVRRRRIALAAALRRFSLTDHFGIDDLLSKREDISIEDMAEILRHNSEQIPSSIPIEFIAKSIFADLEHSSTSNDVDKEHQIGRQDIHLLKAIRPGRRDAPKYHGFALRVLPTVFDGSLANPRKEQPQADKSKFIDI